MPKDCSNLSHFFKACYRREVFIPLGRSGKLYFFCYTFFSSSKLNTTNCTCTYIPQMKIKTDFRRH